MEQKMYFIRKMVDEDVIVPAINFESINSLEGIMLGAKAVEIPVIAQITPASLENIDLDELCYIFKHMRERYKVNVLLHLDHGENLEFIKTCIDKGFESVMIDASHQSIDENIKITREIVEYAHKRDVLVEGGIGYVGDQEKLGIKTRVEDVKSFSDLTEVDLLAISVGNIHGGKIKENRLDFELMKKISNAIIKPLVLHGSSGVVNDDLKCCYMYGVRKINIETEVRKRIREAILYTCKNDNYFKERNMLCTVRNSISSLIKEKYYLFNTTNIY